MLNIIGGVCLLLWGLRNVRNGMTRAFGARLHQTISAGTSNRFTAFLSGIGVTALLQSSTATALITAGFCGRGLMTVAAGIAVMLGADVGTTLVAQVLSFDLAWLMPVLLICGFVLFSVYQNRGQISHVGRIFIGLGLMLMALDWIRETSQPLKDSEVLPLVLQSLEADPIFAVLLAALLTWLAHSSLAIVLLLVSLVTAGVLPVSVGLAMVLGANLGGAMAPLMATLKDSPQASRVPLANLLMRMAGVLLLLPLLSYVQDALLAVDPVDERMIVNFHTGFNILLAVIFLPLTGFMARLVTRLVPDVTDRDDPGQPRYLDLKELDTPTIALASASREVLRMADIVQHMVEDTIVALRNNDESLVARIRARDDVLDKLNKAIKMYMARMTQGSLDPDEAQLYVRILGYATNLENVGDTIDKSLTEMAVKKIRSHKRFSNEGWQEILDLHNLVMETMRLSQSVFVSGDVKLARRLIESKDRVRIAEARGTENHMQRIREGIAETIETSSLHLDIIRDYRRINSYMATVAYPILEETGQLRGSRLKPERTRPGKGEGRPQPE